MMLGILIMLVLLYSMTASPPHHKNKFINATSHNNRSFSQLGAVVYLVNEGKDFLEARLMRKCGLNDSLTMLENNWLKHNPHTVILMNTRPWLIDEIRLVRRYWNNLDIRFVDISKYFNVHSEAEIFADRKNPISNTNYKRMCQFFFSCFQNVPMLREYRYLMRLDDDTCILNPVNFDLFHEMDARNVYYAFQNIFLDPGIAVEGLRDYVADYTISTGLTIANPPLYRIVNRRQEEFYLAFATNLEVIDTWRYRQADIAHFLQNITDSNLIFHRRWGDAPLRMVIAQLFWGPSEVMRLCEFDYQHSNWELQQMCESRTTDNPVLAMFG